MGVEEKSKWETDLDSLKEYAIPVGEEGEEKVKVDATLITCVENVRVIPPPGRKGQLCHIHGHISFSDDLNKRFITHFNRSADDPVTVRLGAPDHDCLSFTQDSTDRCVDGTALFYVRMLLYEKKVAGEDQKSDQGEEDPDYYPEPARLPVVDIEGSTVIANIKDYDIKLDTLDHTTRMTFFGYHGFKVEVSYSIVLGARVKVEVKLNPDMAMRLLPECGSEEKGEPTQQVSNPNKRKHDSKYSIYGCIHAYQNLYCDPDPAVMNLYAKYQDEPTMVEIGSPIPLHRWTVVAPVQTSFLSVGVALWRADNGCQIADGAVRFPVTTLDKGSIITNKRTHTRHDAENVFSVSITFVD